jgi:hypothetical protein
MTMAELIDLPKPAALTDDEEEMIGGCISTTSRVRSKEVAGLVIITIGHDGEVIDNRIYGDVETGTIHLHYHEQMIYIAGGCNDD